MFFDQPLTYAQLEQDLRIFFQAQSHVKRFVIGSSVQGRSIECWRFCANSQLKSSQDARGHSQTVAAGAFFRLQIQAGMHANEWITIYALIHALEGMDAKWRTWFEWDVIPLVNPDGVQLVIDQGIQDWKANANGVDLNDQFPAGWLEERQRRNVTVPGARDFGGHAPLTEPEAQAIVDWTEQTKPDALLSLHTQGREIYYNYRGFESEYAKQWAEQMASAATHETAVLEQYRSIFLTDSDAGCKDWFLQRFQKPAFTIELGLGQNPLPWDCLEEISTALRAMLTKWMEIQLDQK